MDRLRIAVLLLCFPAGIVLALSFHPEEIALSIEEAKEQGIEINFEPEDHRCRYSPSLQLVAPQEIDSMELLGAILMYKDNSGAVLFLEEASGGSICPSRHMSHLVLEYGGGPSKAVFIVIRIEMGEPGPSYNNGFNSDAGKAGAG